MTAAPDDALRQAAARHQAGDLEGAVRLYRALIERFPEHAGAWANLGIALRQLNHLSEAEQACRRALETEPTHLNAANNLGIVLAAQGRHQEAAGAYRLVVERDPKFHEAWCNLGLALAAMGVEAEAAAAFGKALALAPGYAEALGPYIFHKMQCCDWDGLDRAIGQLSAIIKADSGEISPFALMPICRDPAEMLRAARNYSARVQKAAAKDAPATLASIPRPHHERLRIGYVSGDFRQHATTQLTAELFEAHDRSRFEILGYGYGPRTGDAMQTRLGKAFDRLVDITEHSAAEAAQLIRRDEIDILVDLKGYTFDARTRLFAHRPAPIQVNYLGYPGTMGAPFMDYIIADSVIIPPGAEQHYSETIIRLPGSYQPNDSTRPMVSNAPPRAALGLPEHGFVFCCFNQLYKITPDIFGVWLSLLREVPGSVLWLLAFNQDGPARLKANAKAAGIDPGRIVIGPRLPPEAHLARLSRADLFLDTHPCAAHTTASDALWAGVPVLTLAGQVFQSRVAASLLAVLGLDELITTSLADYRAKAKGLVTHPRQLDVLKARLLSARETSELFRGQATARKLEGAYSVMWRNHASGAARHHEQT